MPVWLKSLGSGSLRHTFVSRGLDTQRRCWGNNLCRLVSGRHVRTVFSLQQNAQPLSSVFTPHNCNRTFLCPHKPVPNVPLFVCAACVLALLRLSIDAQVRQPLSQFLSTRVSRQFGRCSDGHERLFRQYHRHYCGDGERQRGTYPADGPHHWCSSGKPN